MFFNMNSLSFKKNTQVCKLIILQHLVMKMMKKTVVTLVIISNKFLVVIIVSVYIKEETLY